MGRNLQLTSLPTTSRGRGYFQKWVIFLPIAAQTMLRLIRNENRPKKTRLEGWNPPGPGVWSLRVFSYPFSCLSPSEGTLLAIKTHFKAHISLPPPHSSCWWYKICPPDGNIVYHLHFHASYFKEKHCFVKFLASLILVVQSLFLSHRNYFARVEIIMHALRFRCLCIIIILQHFFACCF